MDKIQANGQVILLGVIISQSLSIFTVILLLILLTIINLKKDIFKYASRLLIVIMIYMIVFMAYLFIMTQVMATTIKINYYLKFVIYTVPLYFSPFLTGLFTSYFDYKMVGHVKRLKNRHYYMHFLYVIFILSIVNVFYPIFFTIDKTTAVISPANHYYILFLGNYLMFANVYYLLLNKRREMDVKPLVIGVMFFILPILGSALDLYIMKQVFTWPMLGLTTLFLYLYLETSSESKDFLTDLYSRNSLDFHLKFLIDHQIPFKLVMLDLDNFKKINDDYGHHIGDFVLIEFSKILKKVFVSERMISRLGGDEFMVILERDDQPIETYVKEISKLCKKHPKRVMKNLKYSFGDSNYNIQVSMDKNFIKVDKKLYVNKDRKVRREY